jgi:L-erythro-3,5-diaminohexanoate dehydrogenase
VLESVLHRSLGVHRALDPVGVLPAAAHRLDADPRLAPDEVRVAVQRIDLDAAGWQAGQQGRDGDAVRAELLAGIDRRGKLDDPAFGTAGMLVGVVEEVGLDSPLGLAPGQRVATLLPLACVPLRVTDGLTSWDGTSRHVPTTGTAVLFARSIAAVPRTCRRRPRSRCWVSAAPRPPPSASCTGRVTGPRSPCWARPAGRGA